MAQDNAPDLELQEISVSIIRALARRLGGSADVYDFSNEVPEGGRTGIQHRDAIWRALIDLEKRGIVRRVNDPSDHRKYRGYEIPWELC